MRRPDVVPDPTLPARVTIYEVGARDGLQNEKVAIPTEIKAEFIRRLAATGLETIEVTSFVNPTWVPQLADAAELLAELGREGVGPRRPVLVPNERGRPGPGGEGGGDRHLRQRHRDLRPEEPRAHVAESVEMFRPVVTRARDHGLWVRAYVSMCFGDPWEGPVPIAQVVDACASLMDLGADELSLGDTIGVATPGQVVALLDALAERGLARERTAVHFHDTYGQALSNTMTALRHGITTVDSSAGGLGGCPYAKSATGNLATEDLIWALEGAGIDTGVDLEPLVATSAWMAEQLGRPAPSAVVRALAGA